MKLRIGTSGWAYPHWRGVFYPSGLAQAEWFGFYARHFETVELNTTFYRLPSEAMVGRWRRTAPSGFCFAVKGSRSITHLKKLKQPWEPLERFVDRVRRLGDKLGPVLWQLPPRWRANSGRLEEFARRLPTDLTHVFEFRDADWFQPAIRRVLEDRRLTFCVYDMVDHPCPLWVTGDTVYLRFHGSAVAFAGPYGRQRLAVWAERIREWLRQGRTVFAYFNNDLGGHAAADAHRLRDLLKDAN
jgi:uncharacterized protein YecE (DUF72 family)